MSLLYDFLFGSPPKKDEQRDDAAPVKTGVDGSVYIDTNSLKQEKAFRDQVRDFARQAHQVSDDK